MMKNNEKDNFWILRIPKLQYLLQTFKKLLRKKINHANSKKIVKDFMSASKENLLTSLTTAISLMMMLQYRDFIQAFIMSLLPSGSGFDSMIITTIIVTLFSVSALWIIGKSRK